MLNKAEDKLLNRIMTKLQNMAGRFTGSYRGEQAGYFARNHEGQG
jgi:hypothetical protein